MSKNVPNPAAVGTAVTETLGRAFDLQLALGIVPGRAASVRQQVQVGPVAQLFRVGRRTH